MKASIETVTKVHRMLIEAMNELNACPGWSVAECKDVTVCRDVDALRRHIDNATGRASTLLSDLRKVAP